MLLNSFSFILLNFAAPTCFRSCWSSLLNLLYSALSTHSPLSNSTLSRFSFLYSVLALAVALANSASVLATLVDISLIASCLLASMLRFARSPILTASLRSCSISFTDLSYSPVLTLPPFNERFFITLAFS